MAGSYDFKDEEQVKAYLENIEVDYSYWCYKEKNPEGCHRLAQLYDQVKPNKEKAYALYKKTCDEYNYGISCNKLAKAMMLKFLPASSKDIKHYHDKACQYGYNESCYSSALLNMDPKYVGKNKNFPKALSYLEKGCERNDGRCCLKLGDVYNKGKHCNRDMMKAHDYYKKSCDLEELPGCYNLSVMYNKGDGVEKNEATSNAYKDKFLKLYQMQQKGTNLSARNIE